MHWLHLGPTVLAAFIASFVEFIEALTVVLAVGLVRGWHSALSGTAAAILVLCACVMIFGRSLSMIPLEIMQGIVGTLLLLFGIRWLRKAILRASGIIPLHDENQAFAKETASLQQFTANTTTTYWDKIGFSTAFKIVMLEGIEVVFIVIALGSTGQLLWPTSVGAIMAFIVVLGLGLCLHRPLSAIPENTLKLFVGWLLTTFGSFWVGEGVHIHWPLADGAIVMLLIAYSLLTYGLVCLARTRIKRTVSSATSFKSKLMDNQLCKLFIDDGSLAVGVLSWIVIALLSNAYGNMPLGYVIFFTGLAALLIHSVLRATMAKPTQSK